MSTLGRREQADAVDTRSFERVDVGTGVVEGADRRQLDPPLGRHRDQTLDAVAPAKRATRSSKNGSARTPTFGSSSSPASHGAMIRNADCAIVLDAQRREHRDVELGSGALAGLFERPRDVRRAGRLGEHDPVGDPAGHLQRLRAAHAGQHRWHDGRRLIELHVDRDRRAGRAIVTSSPASSRRTATIVSSSVVTGEGVRAPICSIHDCTPWPMPGRNRPGASSHRVAISIAVIAGLRATAGRMPIPTVSRSVVASAVAARLHAGGVEAVLDDPQLIGAALVEAAGDLGHETGWERAVEAHPDRGTSGGGRAHPLTVPMSPAPCRRHRFARRRVRVTTSAAARRARASVPRRRRGRPAPPPARSRSRASSVWSTGVDELLGEPVAPDVVPAPSPARCRGGGARSCTGSRPSSAALVLDTDRAAAASAGRVDRVGRDDEPVAFERDANHP